jgi:hypothetical protein
VQRLQQCPGVGSITTPDGERIELFENAATNLAFTPDQGSVDPIAARHNRPLAGPIAFHHVHLNVPADAVLEAKAWYARFFGGTPGKRSNYDAVDLPGVNINISAASKPLAGTAGRSLDRIGFEVRDINYFVVRLKSMGLGFRQGWPEDATRDVNTFRTESGYKRAEFVDPWGTVIVLTEGLASW